MLVLALMVAVVGVGAVRIVLSERSRAFLADDGDASPLANDGLLAHSPRVVIPKTQTARNWPARRRMAEVDGGQES